MRQSQEPTVTKRDDPMGGERINHPCFGQIVGSRRQGSSVLYDSEFTHNNTIAISIYTSELTRSLSNNWHYADKQLIEIEMSEAQWASFVSSLNIGSGVRCTLRRFDGALIPELPEPITDRKKFELEFGEDIQDAFERLKSLETMIEESKLSGKAKEEITKKIASIRASFTSSMPFVAEQFAEHMENTVEKAKIEINAYATQTLVNTGIAALDKNKGNPVIEFKDEK